MKKLFIIFLLLFYSTYLVACPNCGGSSLPAEKNKILILGVFILFTYIPMTIVFLKAIKKRKKVL